MEDEICSPTMVKSNRPGKAKRDPNRDRRGYTVAGILRKEVDSRAGEVEQLRQLPRLTMGEAFMVAMIGRCLHSNDSLALLVVM